MRGRPQSNGHSLAPLRRGGSAPPLFCIHGLGGHIASFLPLAGGLGPAAARLRTPSPRARRRSAAPRPHRRHGGLLLERDSRSPAPRTVSCGRLVDGRPDRPGDGQPTGGRRRRRGPAGHARHLSFRSPSYEELDLDDESVLRWLAPHLNLSPDELKKLPLERQWERIAQRANLADGIGAAEIRRLAAVCKAHLAACAAYRPKPYRGRAVLFRADEEGDEARPAVEVALSPALRGTRARQSLQHVAQTPRRRAGRPAPGAISKKRPRRPANDRNP